MPHSYTDFGWLGTIDEYFYGYNLDLYKDYFNQILSTVLEKLSFEAIRTLIMQRSSFLKCDRTYNLLKIKIN
jgi:hypothetical protein